MDRYEQINECDYLDLLDRVGIGYKKAGISLYLLQTPEGHISHKSYVLDLKKNKIFDKKGAGRPQGNPFNFIKESFGIEDGDVYKFFEEIGVLDIQDVKIEKNIPKKELLTNFEKYQFDTKEKFELYKNKIIRYLRLRGFPEEVLENLSDYYEIFSKLGMCNNPTTIQDKETGEWVKTCPVLIFPSYKPISLVNNEKKRVGCKMRRIDNKKQLKTDVSKSINITGSRSGILWSEVNEDQMILVEGELDGLALEVLGYKNVIYNLGGVASCRNEIKMLCKHTKEIVILYDNDDKESTRQQVDKAVNSLMGELGGRGLRIKLPKLGDYKDVNDFVAAGWRKDDFDKLIEETRQNKTEQLIEDREERKERAAKEEGEYRSKFQDYVYLEDTGGMYCLSNKRMYKFEVASLNLGMDEKTLKEAIRSKTVPRYKGICYLDGGKEGYLNIFDKNTLCPVGDKAEINPEIDFLFTNVCGGDEKVKEWLMKTIRYKYTHLNDFGVPGVFFQGWGGSGKGMFVTLLKAIFGETNCQVNLNPGTLSGKFTDYRGEKLVVEFSEFYSGKMDTGKKIASRLKQIINAKTITVEYKGLDSFSMENIAWFILESNDTVPIQMDSGLERRLTIIQTGQRIPDDKGAKIHKAIYLDKREEEVNIESIGNFLAYLKENFGYVEDFDSYEALQTSAKDLLMEANKSIYERFFEWVQANYNENFLTGRERTALFRIFAQFQEGFDVYNLDSRWVEEFNKNLPQGVKRGTFNIPKRGRINGYKIGLDEIKAFPLDYLEREDWQKPTKKEALLLEFIDGTFQDKKDLLL